MIIQHNLPAMNSHRQMGINNLSTSKNLEKLSSGYKINRAGDDAAGLAISEKMRGQIRGLNMATQNANNGISLIQTAEGGLNETHDILQRMRELAVQSANGTYDDDVDRANLTKEVDALKSEIDRISSATNYNGIKLLDGSLSGVGGAGGTTKTTGIEIDLGATAVTKTTTDAVAGKYTAGTVAVGTDAKDYSSTMKITYTDETGAEKTLEITATEKTDAGKATNVGAAFLAEIAKNEEFSSLFTVVNTGGALSFEAKTAGNSGAKIGSVQQTITINDTAVANPVTNTLGVTAAPAPANAVDNLTVTAAKSGEVFTVNGQKFAFVDSAAAYDALDKDVNGVLTAAKDTVATDEAAQMAALIQQKTGITASVAATTTVINLQDTGSANSKGLTFQIGANGTADQKVTLNVSDMSTSGLGVKGISVGTQDDANKAIDLIDKAINSVSGTRADLGALQNRLEHTVNNLGTTKENLQAAEASIRDVDMAKEMMEFTKNNILVQASQSMLAQSNQLPQGVLQLLR